jgi:hypothetical protein
MSTGPIPASPEMTSGGHAPLGSSGGTIGSEQIIVKEGWLRKKGSRANLWSERYFVLRGPSLFYFIKSDNVVSISLHIFPLVF